MLIPVMLWLAVRNFVGAIRFAMSQDALADDLRDVSGDFRWILIRLSVSVALIVLPFYML